MKDICFVLYTFVFAFPGNPLESILPTYIILSHKNWPSSWDLQITKTFISVFYHFLKNTRFCFWKITEIWFQPRMIGNITLLAVKSLKVMWKPYHVKQLLACYISGSICVCKYNVLAINSGKMRFLPSNGLTHVQST